MAKANLAKGNRNELMGDQEQKLIALTNNNPKLSDNKKNEISGRHQIIPGRSKEQFQILTGEQ